MHWGFFPELSRRIAEAGLVAVSLNVSGSGIGDDLENFTEDEAFAHNTYSKDLEDLEVVRTITSLGKSLHMVVIAEGVETERQLEELRALGCQYGQGFLFGRPRPAVDVTQLLLGDEARA